jgi:hypothetical protein
VTARTASRQKDEIIPTDSGEPSDLTEYRQLLETLLHVLRSLFGLATKPFSDFTTRLAVICCSTDPEAYFSKEMFRYKFGVRYNRVNEIQSWIVNHSEEFAKNGYGIIAPLRVWFEGAKNVK